MGQIHEFKNEKLIIGVLTTVPEQISQIKYVLQGRFGSLDFESDAIDFTYSKYYNREMGPDIKRFFLAFRPLVPPDELVSIKHTTNEVEQQFIYEGNRKVNLDPGILNLSRLILASTKDNMHRIPLQNGIYGEVTLVFMHGAFQSLLWTYPDYASEEYKSIFTEIREIYRGQLKQQPA